MITTRPRGFGAVTGALALSMSIAAPLGATPSEPGPGGEVVVPAGRSDWPFWSAADACWMGNNTAEAVNGKFVSTQAADFASFTAGDGPFSTCAPAADLALCSGETVNPGTRKTGWYRTYASGDSALYLVTAGSGTRTNHGWTVAHVSGECVYAGLQPNPSPNPRPTPQRPITGPTSPPVPTTQPPGPPQISPNPPPVTTVPPPVKPEPVPPVPPVRHCSSGPNGYSTRVLAWFDDQEPYISIDVVAYCRVNGSYVNVPNGTCSNAVPGYAGWRRVRSGHKNVYVCTGVRTGDGDR
ncbi:MAG: hypothetical protein OXE86_05495 [Alphaproteobacteria bacterium]|nr:hypothetical protein [Alphaproteobacteria bacterium]